MLDELATTVTVPAATIPAARPRADCGGRPLSWRLAAPLIGSASIGLWMLLGRAITLLLA